MPTFREGDRVRIRLRSGCADGHPHDASKDGAIGKITDAKGAGGVPGHHYFVLFSGRPVTVRRMGPVAPILGHPSRVDELERLDEPGVAECPPSQDAGLPSAPGEVAGL